jgi:hypothetical protein
MKHLLQLLRDNDFTVEFTLGKSDVLAIPSGSKNWYSFLNELMGIRHDPGVKILSTATNPQIKGGDVYKRTSLKKPRYRKAKTISVSQEKISTAVKNVGEKIGFELINHLYAFNSLIQNEITGNAYEDVSKFPKYLLKRTIEPQGILRGELLGALDALRYGCELRAYGTFDHFESGAGLFSRFKGGIQGALLALEFLPNSTFRKCGLEWKGFVVSGWSEKFLSFDQVINVPSNSLWDIYEWWGIYHEIGHVLINSVRGLINFRVPEIKRWLLNNVPESAQNHWLNILSELAAEVIGFEMAFYGDFDLFMKRVWNLISDLEPIFTDLMGLYFYSFRTFFVWLYDNHFRRKNISKTQFEDCEFCFREYQRHIKTAAKIMGKNFPDVNFKPKEDAKLLCKLYEFAQLLHLFLSEYKLSGKESELNEKNTKEVFESIRAGRIWLGSIRSPSAVLYKIWNTNWNTEENKIPFESQIACILSFWNANTIIK